MPLLEALGPTDPFRLGVIPDARSLLSSVEHVFDFYVCETPGYVAAGLVAMPHGRPLYADELTDTLRAKHKAGGFYELVFFMEACESGSMFRGMLNDTMRVFTTTASNATESSWATYCPSAPPPAHCTSHCTAAAVVQALL